MIRKLVACFVLLWTSFANLTMQRKLTLIFIFLITLPILLTSYLSFRNYSESILNSSKINMNHISVNAMDQIDNYLSDLKRVSVLPMFSQDFQQYLMMPGNSLDKQRHIEDFLINLNNIKLGTSTIYLVDNYKNLYNVQKTSKLRSNAQEMLPAWEQLAASAKGLPLVLGKQTVRYSDGSVGEVFTVLREVHSSVTFEKIGLIVFDTPVSFLQQKINQLDAEINGYAILLDGSGNTIVQSENLAQTVGEDEDVITALAIGTSGVFHSSIHGRNYICNYTSSAYNQWKLITMVPQDALTQSARINRLITLRLDILFVAIALLVAISVSLALTRPLKRMAIAMNEVKRGNMDIRLPERYEDEVGMLSRQFNHMLMRIKELVIEVYTNQLRRKDAELKALQTQINPHFISNTLETIRMSAETSDNYRASEMIYILGELLRYTIIKENETVTVEQELIHLENYLYLQNVRFNEKYQLKILMEPDYFKVQVVKLLFQPIVENAIYHGLEGKEGECVIEIGARHTNEFLCYDIRDNGKGMSRSVLQALNDKLSNISNHPEDEDHHGIGLSNVNDRIKLYFGEKYGLVADSAPEKGTLITMKLPGSLFRQTGDER